MTVLGLTGTLAGLARAVEDIMASEGEALEEGALVVRDAWVANIESDGLVLTGAYRDSIRAVRGDAGEAGVVSDVEYAGILEFGDSRQVAHFPATRASEEHAEDVLDRVGEKLRGVI